MNDHYFHDLEEKCIAANLKAAYVVAIDQNHEDSVPTMLVITLPNHVADVISVMAEESAIHTAQWLELVLTVGIDALCMKWNLNDPKARELLAKEVQTVVESGVLDGTKH